MLKNLYGNKKVEAESIAVGKALRNAATKETAHPFNQEDWSPEHPTTGHCDVFDDIDRDIWGRDPKTRHWDPNAHILVWWAYANFEQYEKAPVKNKLTVHYSFDSRITSEIDHSRDQFDAQTYLRPRPSPPHVARVDKKWHPDSHVQLRRERLEPTFARNLIGSPLLPDKLSPGLETFLEELQRRYH